MDEQNITDETFVYFGDEVKVISQDENGVKVGGHLVRFGDPEHPDMSHMRDFFTKDTNFGLKPGQRKSVPVYLNHAMPLKTEDGRYVIVDEEVGEGEIWTEDSGVLIEAILYNRKEYEKAIAGQYKSLGWSSGTLGHVMKRVPQPNGSNWVKRWIIGEGSVTPMPAEPRIENMVVPLKSISEAVVADKGKEGEVKNAAQSAKENFEMEINDFKALLDESNKTLVATIEEKAEAAATKAVEKALDNLPEVKAAMNGAVEVIKDETEQPFKSAGEFFMAVKNAALAPHAIDPRLKSLKATGLSEAQPSQAGFLVPQQTAPGIVERMYQTGTLLSLFTNRDQVTGNNMSYNIVDETSRANGSRWGGLQGFWLNEGGTKTASKPKFRQLELKLKKVAALCVATDELLEDAPALEGWLTRTVPQELRFMVEDAIINGDGVGKPLGILNSAAIKSVTRTDANEIDAFDLARMWAGRYAGANDYIWLGNQAIFPQILTMTLGNQPMFLPAGGLSGLPYSTFLGRPYYDIEYAPALGTAGDLILFSPSQYQLIEKAGGIQTASSIHVYFTTDETAFRFVYRIDGAPTWNSVLTLKDGSTTVSPFVVLGAST